ncbi:alpha/beta hydrolase family protein [Nocardia australiensis]|uniref:alpha/beta hydrolase family protein n=1 Tax=Nocardia australiensis TaxID=2887191 RepID=UPI001D13AB6A|nr:alpha/beta fold hydrolase [Nocardia australiensis]
MRTGRVTAFVLLVIAALVVGCSSGSDSNPPEPTTGDWHGAIEIPGKPIDLGVTFTDNGAATIDIPMQSVHAAPLKDVKTDRTAVEFAIADFPGDPKYRGTYDSGTDKITGDYTQSGQSFPLTLQRGKVAEPVRPQEPQPPFPYQSDEVTYRSGDITIAGTLTKPQGDGRFPAVLMITGSGPQDRNEEILGHKSFLLIADTLTRAGYAVLRVDDRGVGGTGGKLDDANYTDLADDAAAGVSFLRARPDVDPARVGLFGHSEGGYLAPLVASRPDSGVAFAILMAGPAVVGADVVVEQTKLIGAAEGTPADELDTQVRDTADLMALVRTGDIAGAKELAHRQNAAAPENKRAKDSDIDAQFTPYFAALVGYDPAPALQAMRVPVLAFYGGKDLQVPAAQNEQPMRTNLSADPDATVLTFPGLNHLMQPTETGKPSEYSTIETTTSPEVLSYITTWLTQRFPAK